MGFQISLLNDLFKVGGAGNVTADDLQPAATYILASLAIPWYVYVLQPHHYRVAGLFLGFRYFKQVLRRGLKSKARRRVTNVPETVF